jgi:hypothetical protein
VLLCVKEEAQGFFGVLHFHWLWVYFLVLIGRVHRLVVVVNQAQVVYRSW